MRKAEKAAASTAAPNSFEAVTREWHQKRAPSWATATADTKLARLEADVFPHVGKRPIAAITAPELLEVLRKIEGRGAVEVTRRIRQVMGQVFRYAIATGRADRDPAADLRDALHDLGELALVHRRSHGHCYRYATALADTSRAMA